MKELLKKWYVLVIVLLVISTIVFACLFVSTNKKLTNAESEVSKLEEKLERNKNKNKKEQEEKNQEEINRGKTNGN